NVAEGDHTVVQKFGCRDRRLAIIELGSVWHINIGWRKICVIALIHNGISCLDMFSEKLGIKQWCRETISGQFLVDFFKLVWMRGELNRKRLIRFWRCCDEFWQMYRIEQARSHSARESLAKTGQYRQAHP